MDPLINNIDRAATLVGYSSGPRYQFRGEFLFQGIRLADKHVLEVGCGTGAWAIWAALHGAAKVTGIEPEDRGSTNHVLTKFEQNINTLGLHGRIAAKAIRLQELVDFTTPLDVVVMFNVINHLDEESVIALHHETQAIQKYVSLLKTLRSKMRSDGWVIVADCGRSNFWHQLGLRSPFVPTIEWHKHQNPSIWHLVFERSGFLLQDVRWSPLYPFTAFTGNRFVQYFTCSHFVMRFRAS